VGDIVDCKNVGGAVVGQTNKYKVPLMCVARTSSRSSSSFRSRPSHAVKGKRRTIEGYEAMHMIRKGQARWVSDADVRKQNQFIDQLFDLPA
jgi:hypothetical protein